MNKTLNVQKTISDIIVSLSPRTKDVIEKRFGLVSQEPMTLEAIGQKYGITRERVRQIEVDGLKTLRQTKNLNRLSPFFELVSNHLRNQGDFRGEFSLCSELAKATGLNSHQFYFALYLNNNFNYSPDSLQYNAIWSINKDSVKKVQKALSNVSKELQKIGHPIAKTEITAIAVRQLEKIAGFAYVSDVIVNSSLDISKEIVSNPFNEYGLSHWPDISPRGVRDKAYLVMKKYNKPLHFRDVAAQIDKAMFDQRSAHPQTVHNELIKDNRFVLIGRGIYALKDWGYRAGTVKDVLLNLLKETHRPLTKDEIVKKIMDQRLVKENTIFLNLQNKNYFKRTDDGKYTLKDGIIIEET